VKVEFLFLLYLAIQTTAMQLSNLPAWYKMLIDENNDINQQDQWGWNVLHMASARGEPDVVKILLDNGADTYIINNTGKNALELAHTQEIADMIKKSRTRQMVLPLSHLLRVYNLFEPWLVFSIIKFSL
jgi:ankyrin repeat protein